MARVVNLEERPPFWSRIWYTIIGILQTWHSLQRCREIQRNFDGIENKESGKLETSRNIDKKFPIQESTGSDQTQETNGILVPTEPNYPNSVLRHLYSNEFYPNTPENGGQEHPAPNEISTKEELISYKRFQIDGCSKEELTDIAKRELGDRFKGWLKINDITVVTLSDSLAGTYDEGLYLVETWGEKMGHCTALYIGQNGVEYFDSVGRQLSNNKIRGNPLVNKIKFQHQDYYTCGLHSIYFLKKRESDELGSMEQVQKSYPTYKDEDLYKNDHHVIKEIFVPHALPPDDVLKLT